MDRPSARRNVVQIAQDNLNYHSMHCGLRVGAGPDRAVRAALRPRGGGAPEHHGGLELLRPARTVRNRYLGHNPALLFRDFNTEMLGTLQATAWKPGRNRIEALMEWPAVMLADLRY